MDLSRSHFRDAVWTDLKKKEKKKIHLFHFLFFFCFHFAKLLFLHLVQLPEHRGSNGARPPPTPPPPPTEHGEGRLQLKPPLQTDAGEVPICQGSIS